MSRIDEQFLDLLKNGTQTEGIPDGFYAAGQHLNPYSLNQRGLYGTAAALLVMSRAPSSPTRIEIIEGLIRYVNERPEIEQNLVSTAEDSAMLPARLILDWRTVFKCADLLYSLAAAPPAVAGREMLLQTLLKRLRNSRLKSGGWPVDLDARGDHDALATACAIRGLNAVGYPPNSVDFSLLLKDASSTNSISPYVRCYCLLVLLETDRSTDKDLPKIWNELVDQLKPELRDRTEANYEFALGNRQYYVRIPWQLYLISGTALCRPSRLIFTSEIRRILLDCIHALDTNEGYIYSAFGHMKSTRTYSILMDTLWCVETQLRISRSVAKISSAANWTTRVFYSRAAAAVALAAALIMAGFGVVAWTGGRKDAIAAVGPELSAATLLGIIGLLLRRLRNRSR
jgi:hypothetical protein